MLVSEPEPVMFTIEQINDVHARLGSAKTFAEYVLALKALGVERSESYLVDGHSEYFGRDGYRVVSPAVHEVFAVAESGERETFLGHLGRHERGQSTTYLEMSESMLCLAQSEIVYASSRSLGQSTLLIKPFCSPTETFISVSLKITGVSSLC